MKRVIVRHLAVKVAVKHHNPKHLDQPRVRPLVVVVGFGTEVLRCASEGIVAEMLVVFLAHDDVPLATGFYDKMLVRQTVSYAAL